MPNTLSPNMSLILPTVGQEPGPNWALDLNSSLSIVDQHDHSSGSGVQITPAGMNINTDLSFGSHNAISLRSVRLNSQLATLGLGSDINCIYVTNGNLYYNDNVGNKIQITASGAVNGTPGSIGNLIAPAAVTYVPANQTFIFQSNQGNSTPASLDAGNLFIRNIAPSSNYIQIQPNAVLPASYSLTLPSALPVTTSVLLLDSLGNVSTSGTANALSVTTLNASAVNASSSLAIKNDTGILEFKNTLDNVQFASLTGSSSGLALNLPDVADSYSFKVNSITKAVIDNNGIDGSYLANSSVTPAKRSAANYVQAFSGTINFTATNVETTVWSQTLTTSANNKNILVVFEPYYTSAITPSLSATIAIFFRLYVNSSQYFDLFANSSQASATIISPCAVQGVQTIAVKVVTGGGNVAASITNYRITATELG